MKFKTQKSGMRLTTGILCFSVLILPVIVSAYTLLQRLPGLDEQLLPQGGFASYLQWLFKFALAAAAFLAVTQIVIGGVQLIIGGASEQARGDAKDRIYDAIWGLLLAFSAWLILEIINPGLVNMKLEIPDVKVSGVETSTGVEGLINYTSIPAEKRVFNIKSGGLGACKGGLNACQFDSRVVDKLVTIVNVAEQMGLSRQDWQVTEAYPPTVKHIDSCHNNATCVDIAIHTLKPGKLTKENVDILIKAAQMAGFKVVNEYSQFNGTTYDTTTGGCLHIEL